MSAFDTIVNREGETTGNNHEQHGHHTIPEKMPSYNIPTSGTSSPPKDDIESNDHRFIENNKLGWHHGVEIPYTMFKYYKISNNTGNKTGEDDFKQLYTSRVVIEPVRTSLASSESEEKPPPYDKTRDVDPNVNRNDVTSSVFAGHSNIPNVSLNMPSYSKTHANIDSLPNLCYQNHFDMNELTFYFGGLTISKNCSLKHLNIPPDVPLNKISVYFPCQVPPFVSKDILINPFMKQNNEFYMFNSLRGSLTYMDIKTSQDYPGHINSLIGTKISDTHIFFYGGFMINTLSVEYKPIIDRWIITKELVLNKDGYVLDTMTYKFTKIELKAKDSYVHEGRLGAAIVSSVYGNNYVHEQIARAPSPTNSAYVPSSPDHPVSKHPSPADTFRLPDSNLNHASISSVTTKYSSSSSLDESVKDYSASTLNPTTSNSTHSTRPETNHSKPETPTSSQSNHSKSNTSSSEGNSKSKKYKSIFTSGESEEVPKGSKMSNVLSKSSRLFHRNHQRQPSGGSMPQAQQPHSMKNTYYKQVKQHRSNSQHSTSDSRPVSPVQHSILPKPKPEPPKRSSREESPKAEEHHKFEIIQESPIQTKPEPFYPHHHNEGIPDDLKFRSTTPVSQVDNSKDRDEMKPLGDKLRSLFHESIFASGSNGVTIFVFGGFKSVVEDGIKRFVPSNDFLRIDLACSQNYSTLNFHPEALVLDLADIYQNLAGDSTMWPSPRGYFAHSLVSYREDKESCNYDLFLKSDSDSEVLRAASPSSIASETSSFHTSQYGAEMKSMASNPGSFFKEKALLIQGGCSDEGTSYSELYLFLFDTGKWQCLPTYCYDYFERPKMPYEDEDRSKLTKENEVKNAKIVEAELRACHHTALFHEDDGREYLIFMAGFRNDFLRHHDKVPYTSDKFDVSRLTNFAFVMNNSHISRLPVLNLQTQTWSFVRYYYDCEHVMTDKYVDRVNYSPIWINARVNNFGCSVSLNGKSIIVFHGLAMVCPENSEDREKMEQQIPKNLTLWGAHVHYKFPNL